MYSCICKLTYYGTESAKGHHLSVWSPNCCGPAFGSMGILKGASCNQKRVAHEHRKGLLPFEVAAGDREPSHAAKSRPKTISGAYPNKWRPLPCAYCRFGATLSFTVDYLKNLNLPKLPRDFRNSLRRIKLTHRKRHHKRTYLFVFLPCMYLSFRAFKQYLEIAYTYYTCHYLF